MFGGLWNNHFVHLELCFSSWITSDRQIEQPCISTSEVTWFPLSLLLQICIIPHQINILLTKLSCMYVKFHDISFFLCIYHSNMHIVEQSEGFYARQDVKVIRLSMWFNIRRTPVPKHFLGPTSSSSQPTSMNIWGLFPARLASVHLSSPRLPAVSRNLPRTRPLSPTGWPRRSDSCFIRNAVFMSMCEIFSLRAPCNPSRVQMTVPVDRDGSPKSALETHRPMSVCCLSTVWY